VTRARLLDETDSEEIEGWIALFTIHEQRDAIDAERAKAQAGIKR
jgi:hypothetical protein